MFLQLQLHQADLPDGLANLPQPDAIFIGGGLSDALVADCQAALPGGGVLVAHCVTIESEAILTAQWQATGGELTDWLFTTPIQLAVFMAGDH